MYDDGNPSALRSCPLDPVKGIIHVTLSVCERSAQPAQSGEDE